MKDEVDNKIGTCPALHSGQKPKKIFHPFKPHPRRGAVGYFHTSYFSIKVDALRSIHQKAGWKPRP
jgi:hypothetical protein